MGSSVTKASYQPEEERYQRVDEDKLAPLKEFIVLGGNVLLSSVFDCVYSCFEKGCPEKAHKRTRQCRKVL